MNCLIVDDEKLARNLVESYINCLPHLQLVGKCSNPLEALRLLHTQAVDLIFLDIQMPQLSGIDFLKILPGHPLVIFTTAYQEHALESYELDAVDYLLKPFGFERFLQAVTKAGKRFKVDQVRETGQAALPPVTTGTAAKRDYLLVKSEFKVFRIFFDDLHYIESMKEYVAFYTTTGRVLSLGSLKHLEQTLPDDQFMRVHKSYIVSKKKVGALEGNRLLLGTAKIPIGTTYRTEVLVEMFEY